MDKDSDAFRTIGEAAEELDLPQHVLRFWETRFSQIRPMKRSGGRRYYRPQDVELLAAIRHLLYGEGYTIKGVQRILKQQGGKAVIDLVQQLREGSVAGDAAVAAPAIPVFDPEVETPATGFEPEQRALSIDIAPVPSARTMPDATLAQLRQILGELETCSRTLAAARAA